MKGQEVVLHDDDLLTIQEKRFIKVECGNTQQGQRKLLQRFFTGDTSAAAKKALDNALVDIKIARRLATCELGKKDGDDAGKIARWSWSDRLKTKRVKELASIDAIEELVEVDLPAVGTSPALKTCMKAETDLRSSICMEMTTANLEYMVACYDVYKSKQSASSHEGIVWVATGIWKATRLSKDSYSMCHLILLL